MASAQYTVAAGRRLVGRYLTGWRFGLDHARTRLGCCHYDQRRITCSVHLVAYLANDEVDQIILHEIAHALTGQAAGHGAPWRRQAQRLGYTGGRTVEVPEARLSARWRGLCPAGHEVLRHRKPARPVDCGRCAAAGRRARITWQDRGLAS